MTLLGDMPQAEPQAEEVKPIGLPKTLQHLTQQQLQQYIVDALRGKSDEQLAA